METVEEDEEDATQTFCTWQFFRVCHLGLNKLWLNHKIPPKLTWWWIWIFYAYSPHSMLPGLLLLQNNINLFDSNVMNWWVVVSQALCRVVGGIIRLTGWDQGIEISVCRSDFLGNCQLYHLLWRYSVYGMKKLVLLHWDCATNNLMKNESDVPCSTRPAPLPHQRELIYRLIMYK